MRISITLTKDKNFSLPLITVYRDGECLVDKQALDYDFDTLELRFGEPLPENYEDYPALYQVIQR